MRYRIFALAFGLVAAVGPLAFAAAALRPAGFGAFAGGPAIGRPIPEQALWLLLAVAVAIAAALLVDLAFDVVRLRRIKRGAQPIGTIAVRRARVGTSAVVATPTAIGYLHPAVVVPDGFRARVDDGEWDAVIAHESAHLARGDDWAKAVQSAVARACWWLPGLWLIGRALDLERELASDERAAHTTGARRYAACLLRLATNRGSDALAPGFWGRRSHVAIRVERLLRPGTPTAVGARAAALLAFGAMALATLAFAFVAVPPAGRSASVAVARPVRIATVPAVPHRPRKAAPRRVAVRPARAPAARPPARAISVTARVDVHASPSVRVEVAMAPAAPRPAPARIMARSAVAPLLADRPAAVLARPPSSRAEVRTPPIRPVSPADLLAYASPSHVHCTTCFGPLRSPDGAYALPPAAVASAPVYGGGPPAIMAITATASDDPAGASGRMPGMLWVRLPHTFAP